MSAEEEITPGDANRGPDTGGTAAATSMGPRMGGTLPGSMDDVAPWNVGDSDRSARSVKSAERTLALFELFSLHQRPLTIGEIAKLLNIPQPSVSMLIRNLTKLGYIEHDRVTRTYVPTIRIMLLGSWIHRRFSQDQEIERHLDQILGRVGETVLLAIQNGVYSQYVSAQMPDAPNRMEIQSGLLRPVTCTAVGRVLLSLKSDAEVAALVRRCNAEVTEDRLRVRTSEFLDLIQRVREQGYASTAGDMTPGYSALAVAVPGPIGRIPMAVSVGGPTERVEPKRQLILDCLFEYKSHFSVER